VIDLKIFFDQGYNFSDENLNAIKKALTMQGFFMVKKNS
jgi:hypothetical protein